MLGNLLVNCGKRYKNLNNGKSCDDCSYGDFCPHNCESRYTSELIYVFKRLKDMKVKQFLSDEIIVDDKITDREMKSCFDTLMRIGDFTDQTI
jgi:hypothetical protein